jgi:GT2 family glycosyltransferase
MASIKLSCIVPGFHDPLLIPTAQSLLDNSELGDQLEVIVVHDGHWLDPPVPNNDRVRIVHLGKNVGMRGAINAGVRVARGEYLLRTDCHATFGKGYDRILTEQCEDNWIVTPRRYFLDPEKLEVMDIPPVDNMNLIISHIDDEKGGFVWKFFGKTKPGDDSQPIQESMAMQGSCWVMKRTWWDSVIGELQSEGYDTHYQDSHEMVFKTWKAGGKLMVNKNTWHAHKHRKFPRTHGYGGQKARECFKYALDTWGEYYTEEIAPKWKVAVPKWSA